MTLQGAALETGRRHRAGIFQRAGDDACVRAMALPVGDVQLEGFVTRWAGSSGAERANFQLFASELCRLIGVAPPDPPRGMSDEVEARLEQGVTRLRPQDWKSGDKLWVVEAIAPFGGPEEMIKDLKANVFPTREVRYVAMTSEGKKEVREV